MFNIILQILAGLLGLALLSLAVFAAFSLVANKISKTSAEIELIEAQAAHVDQTREAEALNSENLKTAYEKQGVNKFRSDLARVAKSLQEVEGKLGFRITGALSNDAHEEILAKSRAIILGLEDQLDKLLHPAPAIDPNGGSSAPIPAGEGTSLGSPV